MTIRIISLCDMLFIDPLHATQRMVLLVLVLIGLQDRNCHHLQFGNAAPYFFTNLTSINFKLEVGLLMVEDVLFRKSTRTFFSDRFRRTF